jgi:hypothetical protein
MEQQKNLRVGSIVRVREYARIVYNGQRFRDINYINSSFEMLFNNGE